MGSFAVFIDNGVVVETDTNSANDFYIYFKIFETIKVGNKDVKKIISGGGSNEPQVTVRERNSMPIDLVTAHWTTYTPKNSTAPIKPTPVVGVHVYCHSDWRVSDSNEGFKDKFSLNIFVPKATSVEPVLKKIFLSG